MTARPPRAHGRAGPWSLLATAAHELAQPAASASLAVETAMLLLRRGDTGAAGQKLAAAAQHLQRLHDQLLALGGTPQGRAEPGGTDLAPLLAAAFPDRVLPPAPAVRAPVAIVHAVLQQLAQDLRAGGATDIAVDIRTDRGHVLLRVDAAGRASHGARLWLGALSRAGVGVSCRHAAGRLRVVLRLQPAEQVA